MQRETAERKTSRLKEKTELRAESVSSPITYRLQARVLESVCLLQFDTARGVLRCTCCLLQSDTARGVLRCTCCLQSDTARGVLRCMV
jgi:hypothetical protein